MPPPTTTQTKPNAARQLPLLQDQFTPERERHDDRVSRDHTPGSEVQPELQPEWQRMSQQHAMGPPAMQFERGAPTGDDPYTSASNRRSTSSSSSISGSSR